MATVLIDKITPEEIEDLLENFAAAASNLDYADEQYHSEHRLYKQARESYKESKCAIYSAFGLDFDAQQSSKV